MKPTIPRRKFAAISLGGVLASAISGEAHGISKPESEASRFARFVGETFSIEGRAAILDQVRICRPSLPETRPPGVRTEPFSLLFDPIGSGPLKSSTYLVSHPSLGDIPIFLSEVRVPDGVRYEAVFN